MAEAPADQMQPKPSREGGAGAGADVEAESPWRRDEVTYLLHAWRDVAADSSSSSSSDKRDREQRIFDKFCGFFDDGSDGNATTVKRSIKSLKKTRKSLLRSFRFIAVFNQNHVIARTMSSFGGSNWFALPEDEQRRIVKAHYKRKPFAYIDEDMFDAIEMIQETENRARMAPNQPPASASAEPEEASTSSFRGDATTLTIKTEPGRFEERKEDGGGVDLPPTRNDAEFEGVSSADQQSLVLPSPLLTTPSITRFSLSWTREDMLMLLRAWEECLDTPHAEDEPIAVFDNRVYERFQELSGGSNSLRSPLAVRLKKYSLIPTFQFINDFDNGKILPLGSGLAQQISTWFTTSRKYRTAVVQKYYTKSHYAHIEQDMLPTIERIIKKTKSIEMRKTTSPSLDASERETIDARSIDESNAFEESVRVPWSRHETSLLLNAWRYAEKLLRQDPLAAEMLGDVDAFIYKRFVVLCGGESVRDDDDVAAQKRALVNTFELITTFNRDWTTGEDQGWFSLRKGERNRRILQAERPCADIDEHTYNELRWVLKAENPQVDIDRAPPATPAPTPVAQPQPPPQFQPRSQSMPQPPTQPRPQYHPQPQQQSFITPQQPAVYEYVRAVTVWNREEVLHLLRAWTEILDGPCDPNESLGALNERIYDRFLVYVGGQTTRTVKALHAKRDSVISSYQMISEFNKNKMIASNGGGVTWTNDWFSLSHEEQKNVVKVHYKKASFSYLYSDMLPIVEKIIEKTPKFEVPEPGFNSRKPRPNSWTPEELQSFLQAWYELVHEHPRQPTETANAFNARLHRRFKELCGGKTKKPEVSLLTKRRVLTSTYEFIADYNRKTKLNRAGEVVKADWFKLSEVDRRKKMMSSNKNVHTCTNIDEETFKGLDRILGTTGGAGDDQSTAEPAVRAKQPTPTNQRPPGSQASVDSSRPGNTVPSATSVGYLPVPPMKRKAQPSAVVSDRQTRSKVESRETPRSTVLPGTSSSSISLQPQSSPESAMMKQKRDEESLSAIASMFKAQTEHLTSLLHQIKEERKIEHAEGRALLEKVQRDQDEREKDREVRAAEREQARREWEQLREKGKLEREQDRLLLVKLFGLKDPEDALSTEDSKDPSTESEPAETLTKQASEQQSAESEAAEVEPARKDSEQPSVESEADAQEEKTEAP